MNKLLLLSIIVPGVVAAQVPTPPAAPAPATPMSAYGVISVDTTAHPIPLDEAVREAQRNAPAAVAAQGSLKTTAAEVHSAYASFIPNFSVSMGGTHTGGERFDTRGALVPVVSPWQYSDGLNANLDLFDGGRRFSQLKVARADVNSAMANEVVQRFNVATNVKQQYFNVLAARESEAAARTQLEQANQNLLAAVARVNAGVATRSDSLRSVIQVSNAQLALLTAQNNLRVANASLTRLVGSPILLTAAQEDPGANSTVALDSAQIAALALQGPAIRQAEASMASARAADKAARAPYLPTVSVRYGRSGNGTDGAFGWGNQGFAYSNTLSFSLSYPLFNQFSREEAVVRANVAAENAQAQLRDARLLATQNLTTYIGAIKLAQQQVAIQEASVAAAQEDLRVQQQRYALGASTLLDVLTSQTTLNQAQATLIQARFSARMAKAQIEAIVGRDLQ